MGTNAHPASAFAPVVGQLPALLQSEAPAPEYAQPGKVILSNYINQGQWGNCHNWDEQEPPVLVTLLNLFHCQIGHQTKKKFQRVEYRENFSSTNTGMTHVCMHFGHFLAYVLSL
jgi:hypothetical protein